MQLRNINAEILTASPNNEIIATGSLKDLDQMIRYKRRNPIVSGNVLWPVFNSGHDLIVTLKNERFYQYGPNFYNNLEILHWIAVFTNTLSSISWKFYMVYWLNIFNCSSFIPHICIIGYMTDHHFTPVIYSKM